MSTELERFIEIWEREAAKTEKLLEALPRDGYDFRPDPEGRSLGELAWHLVEAEGYGALGIERGEFPATRDRTGSRGRARSKSWLPASHASMPMRWRACGS